MVPGAGADLCDPPAASLYAPLAVGKTEKPLWRACDAFTPRSTPKQRRRRWTSSRNNGEIAIQMLLCLSNQVLLCGEPLVVLGGEVVVVVDASLEL